MWVILEGRSYNIISHNLTEKNGTYQIWVETARSSYNIYETKEQEQAKAYNDMLNLSIKRGERFVEIY